MEEIIEQQLSIKFLASKAMKKILQKISTLYNFIVLDSPPIIPVTDAAILATRVDGVILVSRDSQTEKEALKQSIALLQKVNAQVFGVLINCHHKDQRYGYYYDYYAEKEKV